jgi:hypothetical protein
VCWWCAAQALAKGGSRLWVATTSASVNAYDIPADLQQQQQQQSPERPATRQRDSSGGGAAPLDVDGPEQQQLQQPSHASAPQEQQQQQGSTAAAAALSSRGLSTGASGRHVFGSSPLLRARHSVDPGSSEGEVPLSAPALVIPGSPGVWFVLCVCLHVCAACSDRLSSF